MSPVTVPGPSCLLFLITASPNRVSRLETAKGVDCGLEHLFAVLRGKRGRGLGWHGVDEADEGLARIDR